MVQTQNKDHGWFLMFFLLSIKSVWDPDNVFHHCQSVASDQSEGQSCCPFSSPSSPSSPSSSSSLTGCLTLAGEPCVFPFTWEGVTHQSCTQAGGFSSPWCSTLTDSSGQHQTGHYGDCNTACSLETDCRTVRFRVRKINHRGTAHI